MSGMVGRHTEADRMHWHQTGSRQQVSAGPEAATWSDGDSDDVVGHNRWHLAPRQGLPLEPLLLLHCSPATCSEISEISS